MAGVLYHRPARMYPPEVPSDDIVLATPPTLATAQGALTNALQYIVPLVGTLGSLAFILVRPDPLIIGMVLCTALLSVGMGALLRRQQASVQRSQVGASRQRYRAYLAEREGVLRGRIALRRHRDQQLWPDLQTLYTRTAMRRRIWERRRGDRDHLEVRLGLGSGALDCAVRVQVDDNPLVEYEPELLRQARSLVAETAQLQATPVRLQLSEGIVLSLPGGADLTRAAARSIACQLAASHPPEDLRIIVIAGADSREQWEWTKWLPHARVDIVDPSSGFPSVRPLLATDPPAAAETLGRELGERRERLAQPQASSLAHMLLFVDGYRPDTEVARLPELAAAIAAPAAMSTTTVLLVSRRDDEPSRLDWRFEPQADATWALERTAVGGVRTAGITADLASKELAEAIARRLAPLRLTGVTSLRATSSSSRLVDLLALPRADDVSLELARNRALPVLSAPIGTRADGSPFVIDLREAGEGGMGPHGLVVGSTGSGKSELLRTLVSSLTCTHTVDELNVVFVDYKGGAAFAPLATLPHVAGTITNLEAGMGLVDRMQAALTGEHQRRQHLLRRAGNAKDIQEYWRRRDRDPRLPAMPFLLVVVDEFAALIEANPDFIDIVGTLARQGRGLGVYLLLASQRLDAGRMQTLNPDIAYRICLRTNLPGESSAVLGIPDAAYLPARPGGAGFVKGPDGVITRFQAALVSGPYRDARATAKAADLVQIVGGGVLRGADGDVAAAPSDRVELSDMDVIVAALAHQTDASAHMVWLPPLPRTLTLDRILSKDLPLLSVALGLEDIPAALEERQPALVLDLAQARGHIAVVGAPQTGKSTALRTLLTSLCVTHDPHEVQIYCIDLGGGLLDVFAEAPHVGMVAGKHDAALIARMLMDVKRLIEARTVLFREERIATLDDWRRRRRQDESGAAFGDVFIVVDNLGQLRKEFEGIEGELAIVANTGLKYGVHLVVASNRWLDFPNALLESVGHRLELRLNDPTDSAHGRRYGQMLEGAPPGRILTQARTLAHVGLPRLDGQPTHEGLEDALRETLAALQARWPTVHAPLVRLLPAVVPAAQLADQARSGEGVVIGIDEEGFGPARVDLLGGREPHLLIFGEGGTGKSSALRTVLWALAQRYDPSELRIFVIDARRELADAVRGPYLGGYATAPAAASALVEQIGGLIDRRMKGTAPDGGFDGHIVVVIDDFDLIPSIAAAVEPLAQHIAWAIDTRLHLLVSRRVGRAYGDLVAKLRDFGACGLVMSGDQAEGPMIGNQRAMPMPPGRAILVRRGAAPLLVQLALVSEATPWAQSALDGAD